MNELLGKLLPGCEGASKSRTWTVAPNVSPLDDEVAGRLIELIRQMANQSDLLLLDICYDKAMFGAFPLEWLLYRALTEVEDEIFDRCRLVVLTDLLPQRGERLFLLTPEMNGKRGPAFIARDGGMIEPDAGEGGPVELETWLDYLERQSRELLGALESSFIRERGVFAGNPGRGIGLYKYQYSLRQPVGQRELGRLLELFAEERGVNGILYSDPYGGGWLEASVQEAADEVGLPWCSLDVLTCDESEVDPSLAGPRADISQLLEARENCLLVVVPAYSDGRSLGELLDACRSRGPAATVALTVLMDERNARDHEVESSSWFRMIQIESGRDELEVHFLLSVPIDQWDPTSWAVNAARSIASAPSRGKWETGGVDIGVWSLIADYPVAPESHVPPSRRAISCYPSWGGLDPWDSVWLASRILSVTVERLGCHREAVLVVLPSEDNASSRLAAAFRDNLGIAVTTVSRAVLERREPLPEDDRNQILAFRGLRIVAVDEATRTGETMRAINDVVASIRGNPCNLQVVALNASRTALPVLGLFNWNPVVVEVGDG